MLIEVKQCGEQVIRRDVLAQKHGLNKRQAKALEFLMQRGKLTIQDFETICPGVNRRSLQLKNKLTQRAIAKECADWMRQKAKFDTFLSKIQ